MNPLQGKLAFNHYAITVVGREYNGVSTTFLYTFYHLKISRVNFLS